MILGTFKHADLHVSSFFHHCQEDDAKFPDEVDTPIDTPARIRFAKYRGLKSFRSSPWDPKESLPLNYSYIYQLNNFPLLQKSECTRMDMLCKELEKKQMLNIETNKMKVKTKKHNKKNKHKNKNNNNNNNHMEQDDDDDDDVSMGSGSVSEARLDTLKELDESATPGTCWCWLLWVMVVQVVPVKLSNEQACQDIFG